MWTLSCRQCINLKRNLFQVKIILGDERECTGELLSIDEFEGVVKLDRGDIYMFQTGHLCKMPDESTWDKPSQIN